MIQFIILFFNNVIYSRLNIVESFIDVQWSLKFQKEHGYMPFLAFENPNEYPPEQIIELHPKGYIFGVICHNN